MAATCIGPALLAHLFTKKPVGYAPQQVMDLHHEIEGEIRAVLASRGFPPLPTIEAAVYLHPDFVEICRQRKGPAPEGFDVAASPAQGSTTMQAGKLIGRIIYDVNTLETRAEQGTLIGQVMAHEVTAFRYGHFMEVVNLAGGLADGNPESVIPESDELSLAGEGWACYFSQAPFRPYDLLMAERGLVRSQPASFSLRQYGKTAAKEPHFFVALALLKTEMAFGFDRVVQLARELPGFDDRSSSPEIRNVIREFWKIYDTANRKLRYPSPPLSDLMKVRFA